ncbi:uncharacterized protein LOC129748594 [Uranotaenia lowii]|uniref:uncharacterized protein LOC129748594 n=1 Tax=Uranotaenia lowii TaxID=190385 RepID=UPI00247AEC7E|nr:uncharacterized protein LOC129748594 [Uranotaenia lowii]
MKFHIPLLCLIGVIVAAPEYSFNETSIRGPRNDFRQTISDALEGMHKGLLFLVSNYEILEASVTNNLAAFPDIRATLDDFTLNINGIVDTFMEISARLLDNETVKSMIHGKQIDQLNSNQIGDDEVIQIEI